VPVRHKQDGSKPSRDPLSATGKGEREKKQEKKRRGIGEEEEKKKTGRNGIDGISGVNWLGKAGALAKNWAISRERG